jgi:type VI secretion system protein ImpB
MNEGSPDRHALPRILVVGDFAPSPIRQLLTERIPSEVRQDNFDAWLKELGVKLEVEVPNVMEPQESSSLTLLLRLNSIARLTPDAIVSTVPILAKMRERIIFLRGLKNMVSCIPSFRKFINHCLVQPNLRQQLVEELAAPVPRVFEPPSIVRELLDIARLRPEDEGYDMVALTIRHLLRERLAKGATTIDAVAVMAEADRVTALLAGQVAQVFQNPMFRALERTWRGLAMFMRYDSLARIHAVQCSEDELREHSIMLWTWLEKARQEKSPYAAVLVALDLDELDFDHKNLADQLAAIGAEVSTPIFVGMVPGREPMMRTSFFKPISTYMPVRPRYGEEDGEVLVRGFRFYEPEGGPPRAYWPAAISVLAQEFGFE